MTVRMLEHTRLSVLSGGWHLGLLQTRKIPPMRGDIFTLAHPSQWDLGALGMRTEWRDRVVESVDRMHLADLSGDCAPGRIEAKIEEVTRQQMYEHAAYWHSGLWC